MTKAEAERYGKYKHVKLERTGGILLVTLHTDHRDIIWSAESHDEVGECFGAIAGDPANEVVILTGAGDSFISRFDGGSFGEITSEAWNEIAARAHSLLFNLLSIRVPVIGAVNGPATIHAELALLSDIVIASEQATFRDAPHFVSGRVPGDGAQVTWMRLLGPNRGRYFLLTGEEISAADAERLGVVAEVVPRDMLIERAWELARTVCRQPRVVRENTREVLMAPIRRWMRAEVPAGLGYEGLGAVAHWPREEP